MKKTFRLDGLDCANCAAKIERGIQGLAGVTHASVNFMTSKLVIEAEDGLMPQIIAEAERIVRKVEPDTVMRKV